MVTKIQERCPHIQPTGAFSTEFGRYFDGSNWCELNNKPCTQPDQCDVYKEYLQGLEAQE